MGRTHNLILYNDDGRLSVETVWKPEGIQQRARDLPSRRFVMACRPLCGMDLKRPHLTCITGCRIRRVYYDKLPKINQLERIVELRVMKRRRFAALKDAVMKQALTLIENLLCN
jgi:hypothetical protein